MTPISPVADKLGTLVAPKVKLGVDAIYDDVQHEGNLLERVVARKAYPLVVRKVPEGSKVVCHHVLDHLGTLTIGDLAGMLVEHAQATGGHVHPSVAALRFA